MDLLPQVPQNNACRRTTQIQHSSIYHLMNIYIVTVVQSTKRGREEKCVKFEQMGQQLGARIMESLASTSFDKIHINNNPDVGKYTDYIRFLGKDFWIHVFGQQVSNVKMQKTGPFYELEDRYEEQKKANGTVIRPGFQMTRRIRLLDKQYYIINLSLQDEYLHYWSCLLKGLIKGAMKALTLDSEVEVAFLNNEPSDLKFSIAIV